MASSFYLTRTVVTQIIRRILKSVGINYDLETLSERPGPLTTEQVVDGAVAEMEARGGIDDNGCEVCGLDVDADYEGLGELQGPGYAPPVPAVPPIEVNGRVVKVCPSCRTQYGNDIHRLLARKDEESTFPVCEACERVIRVNEGDVPASRDDGRVVCEDCTNANIAPPPLAESEVSGCEGQRPEDDEDKDDHSNCDLCGHSIGIETGYDDYAVVDGKTCCSACMGWGGWPDGPCHEIREFYNRVGLSVNEDD